MENEIFHEVQDLLSSFLKKTFVKHFEKKYNISFFFKDIGECYNNVVQTYMQTIKENFLKEVSFKCPNVMNKYFSDDCIKIMVNSLALINFRDFLNVLVEISSEEKIGYYKMFSGDFFTDNQDILEKFDETLCNHLTDIINITKEVRSEFKDFALDEYNKDNISLKQAENLIKTISHDV